MATKVDEIFADEGKLTPQTELSPKRAIEITPKMLHSAIDDTEDEMVLRKRRGWEASTPDLRILDDDDDDELVEEDDAGCPLPSTPEDTQLIEAEVILH